MTRASTTKKGSKKVQHHPMRRFWLVISCIAILTIWFCLWILLFHVQSAWLNQVLEQASTMYVYDTIFILGGPAILVLAAAITVPMAYALFRRQQLEAPLLDAVGLLSSVVFAYSLFTLLLLKIPAIYDLKGFGILAILAVCFVISTVAYGLMLRVGTRKAPRALLYTIMIGLPVVAILIVVVSQLSLLPIW